MTDTEFGDLMSTPRGIYMREWAARNTWKIVKTDGGALGLCVHNFPVVHVFDNFDEMSGWIRGVHNGVNDFKIKGDGIVLNGEYIKRCQDFIDQDLSRPSPTNPPESGGPNAADSH
jgi:hypothetical protein